MSSESEIIRNPYRDSGLSSSHVYTVICNFQLKMIYVWILTHVHGTGISDNEGLNIHTDLNTAYGMRTVQ